MQSEPWVEFWNNLGLALFHFDDVGLTPTRRGEYPHLAL
jgi:hypothetical protein